MKVTSLDIEAGDQQRYSPPGRCIYCLADGVELTDEHVVPYTAQRLLDYVLGCNALNHGFVSHGERATRRPYHWTCRVRGIVMPGWASGGSNGGAPGADPRLKALIDAKTPPAKCFVGACENDGSWASNEGQTSENAALLLATGLFGL